MTEVTRHVHGMPSWDELATSDMAAAETFYSALFGWKADHQPMGPDEFYGMQQLRGKNVAAIFTQRQEEASMGIPPHWQTYITVDDVDATVEKVKPAGGNVLAEPFDVFDAGRMAIVADPEGAMVSLWQPKNHIGAQIINDPGTMCWHELWVNDVGQATTFYENVLGLTTADSGIDDWDGYKLLNAGSENAAGVMKKEPEMSHIPSSWTTYFAVTDCDAAVKQAVSLGASNPFPPTDVPTVGRFAILIDPQGAAFGVLQG
ncbi:MAG: VOC family protein [Dehalococcoidia bacterium]